MNNRLPFLNELQCHIDILEEEGHDVLETLKIILDESFDCEVIEKSKANEIEDSNKPKRPNLIQRTDFNATGICPNCGNSLMKVYHIKYCGECSQALDWAESEGEKDES